MDLRKLRRRREYDEEGNDAPRRSRSASRPLPATRLSKARSIDSSWHGRPSPPPPPGSSYEEFLDWAAQGGIEWPGDAELATRLWMARGESAETPSAPTP